MPINTMFPCKFLGSGCNGRFSGDGLWLGELEVQQSGSPTGRPLITSGAGLLCLLLFAILE